MAWKRKEIQTDVYVKFFYMFILNLILSERFFPRYMGALKGRSECTEMFFSEL